MGGRKNRERYPLRSLGKNGLVSAREPRSVLQANGHARDREERRGPRWCAARFFGGSSCGRSREESESRASESPAKINRPR